MSRLKYLARFQKGRIPPELFKEPAPNRAPYLSMEYLRSQTDFPEFAETDGAVVARDNDIILLWDGSNAGEFIRAKHGVVSSTAALASVSSVLPDYFFYLCKSLEPNIRAETVGMGIPHVNGDFVGDLQVTLPPENRQRDIAAFLDSRTGELDQLIIAKQRLLSLLIEKRRTVIADFLTKGLNKDAPRRNSGIPWLGNIPAHWDVERAKWLFTERDDRSDSGDEELLTVSHLTGVTSRAEKDVNMFMAESLEGYKRCQAGDLVINTLWAWMGAMGVARQPGIVSPAYNVYQPVPELDPEYVDLLVRTPRFVEEITRYSKGVWSSRLRLYPEGLYEAWLPLPPLDEQQTIVKHVQIETQKLDALAGATERTITLLQERRSALISAAVTGQLGSEGCDAG